MSTDLRVTLDRRGLLLGVGATLTLGCSRWSLAAAPSIVPACQTTPVGTWGEWAIDDICHHLPRPTARIGLGRRAHACGIDVAALDRQFCG